MPGYREARPVRHTLFFRTISVSMTHNSGKSGEYAVWTIGGGSNPSSSPQGGKHRSKLRYWLPNTPIFTAISFISSPMGSSGR